MTLRMFSMKTALVFVGFLCSHCLTATAMPTGQLLQSAEFSLKHGPQGTGNYKGKRDKHEKPGPGNEKKKKSNTWVPMKK
jgi:hypothetical protein